MYCYEVSFFFQFAAYMMMLSSVLIAVGFGYWWERKKKLARVPLRRGQKRGRRRR